MSPTNQSVPPSEAAAAARTATLLVFAMNGMLFASWASRIPEVKQALELSAGQLGVVLLAVSVGSLIGLPLSGRIAHRLGAGRAVLTGCGIAAVGIGLAALGIDLLASREVLMAGLFLVGLGMGLWDVSMNLEGTAVERALGRAIMPWFHAAFSGGTVLAALLGAGLSAARVPVWLHLVVAMLVCVGVCVWQVRHYLPTQYQPEPDAAAATTGAPPGSAWTEPRTLLVGVVVLAAAFTEGTANDWLAVAFVEGHHLPHWAGVLALAVFLTFMTAGRVLGTGLLDRHGRVPVLRAMLALAAAGCALVVFGDATVAFLGAMLWGVGASLGFPVGISAAADDPVHAARRISVVSTIGYTAFLGGPPVLGWLGDHTGVLHALLAVGVMLVLAFFVTPAAAPQAAPARSAEDPVPSQS
ncbi:MULTISPECIES: MFS transporter [unclassified Luteococcus]|uniref:MFS transporter n=1 Tax=unclassified Luteococcus TaxID=2639923 RepID=UPI00313CDD40